MRAAFPFCLLVVCAGCADLLGIEPWDASPGAGGGSTASGSGPTGSGADAPTSSSSATSTSSGDGGAGAGTTSSSGPAGGDGGQGGASCGVGEERCGEVCADLSIDPAHCGACGHGCFGGSCADARCGAISLGVLDGPRILAASTTAIWILDAPPARPEQIERVDLTGPNADKPPLSLRHTFTFGFTALGSIGAADSLGFFFAGYQDDTDLVLRFLDGAQTLQQLGEVTFPFAISLTSMAPSGGFLWLGGRLVDASIAPSFVQAGVLSLSLSTPGGAPVPRCTRTGSGAPAASDVTPIVGGVIFGRREYGGGPDIFSCDMVGEDLVSVTPIEPVPGEVIADATHVYFTTNTAIYRLPRAEAPSTPELWGDIGTTAFLSDTGGSVVWRDDRSAVIRRPKSGEPAEPIEGTAASHLAAAGDLLAWIQLGTNELMLLRLPPGG